MKSSFFASLRESSGEIWTDYVGHPFVSAIGSGDLPLTSFKYYLVQDYLFLIQFSRAYALAVFKSETIGQMQAAAATLFNILDSEIDLHKNYCSDWGLTPEDLSNMPEDIATTAYTRFVLDCGNRGDLLDLMTALVPCVVGYAEIGQNLVKPLEACDKENPFRNWIEMYSGEEYQEVSNAAVQQLQKLFDARGGANRYKLLSSIFNQATRLEIEFWNMAWSEREG